MLLHLRWSWLACLLALSVAQAQAPVLGIPTVLSYNGRLLKADGTPEIGAKAMRFSLYDASTGGTELWSEVQQVALSEGYYSVLLGAITPFPAAAFDQPDRYLALVIQGSELAPRQRIGSVPFAFKTGSHQHDSQYQAKGLAPTIVTKWGTAVCPTGTTLLYAGMTFNGHYTHTGGGGDPLCVKADDPGPVGPGTINADLLYPSGTGDSARMPPEIPAIKELKCAVCQVDTGPCLDVWGTQTCPLSYRALWAGFSMGPYYDHKHGFSRQCVAPGGFDANVPNPAWGDIWYGTVIQDTTDISGLGYTPNTYLKCAKCCRQ